MGWEHKHLTSRQLSDPMLRAPCEGNGFLLRADRGYASRTYNKTGGPNIAAALSNMLCYS